MAGLFFSQYDLLYFYHAEKNPRVNALSHFFDPTDFPPEPQFIIDPTNIISNAQVHLHEIPPGKIFVPHTWRRQIVSWRHSSKLAVYTGERKSLELISSLLVVHSFHIIFGILFSHRDNWETLLPWAEFSYNNHAEESSGALLFMGKLHNFQFQTLHPVPEGNSLVRDFFCVWQDTKSFLYKAISHFKVKAERKTPSTIQPQRQIVTFFKTYPPEDT